MCKNRLNLVEKHLKRCRECAKKLLAIFRFVEQNLPVLTFVFYLSALNLQESCFFLNWRAFKTSSAGRCVELAQCCVDCRRAVRFTWFSAWCVEIRCGELFQGLFHSLSLSRVFALPPSHDVSQFVCFVFLETKLFNKVPSTKHNFPVTFHRIFSCKHHFSIFPSSFKLNKLIAVLTSAPKSAENILSACGWLSFLRAWVVAIFHETNWCV